MKLLDDLKETRGYRKLKQEALDRTLWRTRFRRGYVWTCHKDRYLKLGPPVHATGVLLHRQRHPVRMGRQKKSRKKKQR